MANDFVLSARSGRFAAAGLAVLVLLARDALPQEASDAATRQYAAAVKLQNLESYDLAIESWSAFLSAYPTDPRVPKALHYLGICYCQSDRFDQAQTTLEKLIKSHSDFAMLDASFLYLGAAQFGMAQAGKTAMYATAAATLKTLVAKYPQSKHLPDALYYLGECAYQQGNKAEAARTYARLLDSYPKSPMAPDALYALGVAQDEQGQTDAAAASFERFLKEFPQHRLASEVTMRRAEVCFKKGQYAEAARRFAQAAASPNFDLADYAVYRQADALVEMKQYAEAAAAYSSIPQKFPKSEHAPAATVSAGKSYYLAGDFEQARLWLQKAVAAGGPSAPEAAHWIAQSALKEKQPEEALAIAEKALPKAQGSPWAAELAMDQADAMYAIPGRAKDSMARYAALALEHSEDPLAPQALYMAAFVGLEQSEYGPASQHALAFLDKYPKHVLTADVTHIAAESSLQLKQFAEAEKLYRRAVEEFPKHPDAQLWKVRLATTLQLEKKYDETIAVLDPVIGGILDPDLLAESQYLIGSSRLEMKQYAEAIDALEASLAAQPKWRSAADTRLALTHALYTLGHDQLSRKDAAAAEQTLSRLLKEFPKDDLASQAIYTRAVARQQMKKYAPAIEDLEAFLATRPADAEKSDARYVLALCQLGMNEHDAAAETLQKLLADNPQYAGAANALYQWAWALQLGGKQEQAARTFARLAKEYPESPLAAEAHHHVGEYFYEKKEYRQAAGAYYSAMEKALEKPGNPSLAEKATYKLGWSYYHQDDFGNAEKTFHYEVANFPDRPLTTEARFMRAECLFKLGNYKEALENYARLTGVANEDFQVLTLLHAGQAAAQLNEWDQSLDWLTQCAEKFPKSAYLPQTLYEQGWAKQNLGKEDEAMALYEQVVAKSNDEVAARAQFMIGELQFADRIHNEAVKSFFKVLYGYSYPQWQAEAAYEAGRCFEVLGKKAQAAKMYEELLEKFPNSDKAPLAKQRIEELGVGSKE